MTTADLKKLLEALPDHMPVCLHAFTHRGASPLQPLPYVDSVGAVVEQGRVVICSYREPEIKFQ